MPTLISLQTTSIPLSTSERIQDLSHFIGNHLDKHFTIQQLAYKVKLPEKTLKQLFRQHFGMGLFTYLSNLRIEKAKAMLLEGINLKEVVQVTGYESESTFCRAFRKHCQESPIEWKNRCRLLLIKKVQ